MRTLSRIRTYVPRIDGNQTRPANEQFSVKMKSVDVKTKQDQLRKFVNASPEDIMTQMLDPAQSSEIKSLLEKHVVGFENLEVTDENNNSAPATIKDVWELGEHELCLELFMNLLASSQLKRVQQDKPDAESEEKNSALLSGITVM